MFKEGKVGVYEMICLLTITITAKIFFVNTSQLAELVGNAAWLETLITGIFVLINFYFVYILMKKFKGKNLIEIYNLVYGNIISKIIFTSIIIFFIIYIGFILREFVDILKNLALPLTPISVTILAFLIAIVLISYRGLEALTRTAAFFSLLIILVFILIIFLPFNNFRVDNLFPIFGKGLDKIFIYGFLRTSSYAELIALPVLIKSLQGLNNFKKIGYWTIVIAVLTFTLSNLCYTLVLPYSVANAPASGLFTMTRTINYGRFLQRFEAVFIFGWVLSSLLNLSFGIYFLGYVFSKTFNLPDYKPLIIPFSILIYTISIIPQNFSWVAQKGIYFIRTYSLIPSFGLIILALILAIFRKKKGATENA